MNPFNLISLLRELQTDIRNLTAEMKKLRLELQRQRAEPGATKPRTATRTASRTVSRATPAARPRPRPRRRPVPESSVPVSGAAQKAADYLHQQGFVIRKYQELEAGTTEERILSKFLGDRHESSVESLYSLLRDVEVSTPFSLDLSEATPREIADSVQLCQFLSNIKYLDDYMYARGKRLLTGSLTAAGDQYIRGQWLEQYIRRQLVSGFGRAQMGYSLLMNPNLTFQDGQECELDLFAVERDMPLWIECTTARDPRERLAKMRALRRKLEIPAGRALLVVAGMSSRRIQDLSRNTRVTIANVSDFPDILDRNLE